MKALVGAFNQEKALVGAFSVIVETDCESDGALHSTNLDGHLVAVGLGHVMALLWTQSSQEKCIGTG